MSEEKNGYQQPNVEKIQYSVCTHLKQIEDEWFYELLNEVCDEVKILYINVDRLVLVPGMNVYFYGEEIEDESVLDIEVFDEYTCSRLIEKYNECLYKADKFEILFTGEVKKLNELHSGTVMEKVDSESEIDNENTDVYEVRLNDKLIIESIKRTFKKIYVHSNDLLNGFEVKNLKINPFSLFDCNHEIQFDKPVLYSCRYDKKDILSNDDLWLLRKSKIYSFINEGMYALFFYSFILVILVNIFTTSSFFIFSWPQLIIFLGIPLAIILFQAAKRKDINDTKVEKKDDLKTKNKKFNFIGTIFGAVLFIFSMYGYSATYSFGSTYIYDSKNKIFLESNKVVVDSNLVFRKDKILDRFIFVEGSYIIDLVYQTPGSLLSFSNKYIDLEINFVFKKGKFLLGLNMKDVLSINRNEIQKNLSSGFYGDLSNMNNYEHRKALIVIEEDLMKILTLAIISDEFKSEDIVESVTITTKYAKLQNVD